MKIRQVPSDRATNLHEYGKSGIGNDKLITITDTNKQRVLTPGHQGWNDLHSLCRIGMEYYLLNNDDDDNDNNNNNNDDNNNNNDNDN